MTRINLITACLFFALFHTNAQNNHLKLYLGLEQANHLTFQFQDPLENNKYFISDISSGTFFALAFAHENAQSNFWELSAESNAFTSSQIVYRKPKGVPNEPLVQPVGDYTNKYARLQFEYNWIQPSLKDAKLRLFLGAFVRAGSQWGAFHSNSSAYNPHSTWNATLSPGVIPRFMVRAGNRLQLEISSPISLGHFKYEEYFIDDPALSNSKKTVNDFDIDLINLETQIRVGIVYALNKPEKLE